jgi:hypothetical protein
MALVSKLATKATKKPAVKNVRSMVEAIAAARKEASTFKTIDQLKKEAIDAKPSTKKAVAPSSSEAARRQKAETRLLAATGSMFTAGAAYENAKQKKGAPKAEAKGRRGGNIGTLPIAPQSSKKSIAEESDEEYRKIEADRIDRGLGPRSRDVTPKAAAPKAAAPNAKAAAPKAAAPNAKAAAPNSEKKMLGGREVKNGKVFVSMAELNAFKKKYGTDKTLTDLLNAERGLTRRDAPAKKAKAALKPIQSQTQFRAEQDKMAAKKKALQEKARKETGKR